MEIEALKIGPVTYTVIERSDLHYVDVDGRKQFLHGQIVFDEAEIRVCTEQTPDLKAATVLHEAIHAILKQAGHPEHSEALVEALGYGLMGLMRDNPALVELVMGQRFRDLVPTDMGVNPHPQPLPASQGGAL